MPVFNCYRLFKYRPVLLLPGSLLLFLAVLAVTSSVCVAGEDAIAVIYPDIGEPYREVFEKIIDGVDDKVGTQVANYPVNENTDIAGLRASLLHQHIRVVIALGRQGMKAATSLNIGVKVVVGGVLTMPENEARELPVISLSPDPALLFARMKSLKPAMRRLFVVYNPGINGWLIKMAKDAASAQGLELAAYAAQDLRTAVHYYQEIFSAADGRSDALWLPQDPVTVEDGSVLPLVLQESWKQGIAVFSSNVSHVRRGALFSLYPDNVGLGRSLAGLAQETMRSNDYAKRGMMPLRAVQSAGNLRTANHLGINLGQQQSFDMTFPEQ